MLDFSTLQVASISSRLAFIVVFLVTLSRHPSEFYFGIWASALGCSLIASFMRPRSLDEGLKWGREDVRGLTPRAPQAKAERPHGRPASGGHAPFAARSRIEIANLLR